MTLLLIHLACAVGSVGAMVIALGSTLFHRNRYGDRLLKVSGWCFGGLLASGTALVIKYHAGLTGACLAGLSYFAVLAGLQLLYKKLAAAQAR